MAALASVGCWVLFDGPTTAQRRPGSGVVAVTDQPWTQTADRSTWRAYRRGLVLTVTRLGLDQWRATVEGPGTDERSPVLPTGLRAQAWADGQAGGAR